MNDTILKVREHPILYSTPMIQAKLAGRKTQTRRIIKESFNGCLTNGGPHPCPNDPVVMIPGEDLGEWEDGKRCIVEFPQVRAVFHCSTLDSEAKCPFGKVGDLLWSRENFSILDYWPNDKTVQVLFQDGKTKLTTLTDDEWSKFSKWKDLDLKKPSLFLFKSMSRIWERVTNIHVESLQDITEQDAIAEGVEFQWCCDLTTMTCFYKNYTDGTYSMESAKDSYKTLWEKINGPGSWEQSPWVWVVTTEILSTTGRPDFLTA